MPTRYQTGYATLITQHQHEHQDDEQAQEDERA
jgi:hypothetical protein